MKCYIVYNWFLKFVITSCMIIFEYDDSSDIEFALMITPIIVSPACLFHNNHNVWWWSR